MSISISCSNCGAKLQPTGKTTRLRCPFCQADNLIDPATLAALAAAGPVAPTEQLELVKSALQPVMVDGQALLDALARRLKSANPDGTTIEAGGFFSGGKTVKVTSQVGDFNYELTLAHSKVHCNQVHTVRGIALKKKELGVDQLIHAITAELFELSQGRDPGAFDRFLKG